MKQGKNMSCIDYDTFFHFYSMFQRNAFSLYDKKMHLTIYKNITMLKIQFQKLVTIVCKLFDFYFSRPAYNLCSFIDT